MKQIFTIPNIITFFRILLVPIFGYFFYNGKNYECLIALTIFLVASFSDFLDGYLARKLNQTTRLGIFLDPLADKILILTAFIILFLNMREYAFGTFVVAVILLRDIAITSLRGYMEKHGQTMITSKIAKFKTGVQMFAIYLLLAFFAAKGITKEILPELKTVVEGAVQAQREYYWIQWISFFVAAFTFYTGVDYFIKNWKSIRSIRNQ